EGGRASLGFIAPGAPECSAGGAGLGRRFAAAPRWHILAHLPAAESRPGAAESRQSRAKPLSKRPMYHVKPSCQARRGPSAVAPDGIAGPCRRPTLHHRASSFFLSPCGRGRGPRRRREGGEARETGGK